MTPYATWVQSKAEMPFLATSDERHSCGSEKERLFQEELCGFLELIVENLMTSSAAQLRISVSLMQQQLEEKRQETLRSQLLGELSKIEERTTAMVAEALLPVLSEIQHSRVIKEFAAVLKKTLPEFAQQRLTVSAPVDVHNRLSVALKLQSIEADVVTNDDCQIVVAGSNVVLRAELDQWARNLSEVAAA